MAAFLVPKRSATVRWRGTLEGLLPQQHPARFIWQAFCSLNLSKLEERYSSVWAGPGRPPYHPRVLIALWIYGISEGLETAAGIAKACRIREDFRWLAGGLCPSDQTLLNFLTGSEVGLASIWAQLLKSMHQAGHIDLSVIAEDGTKLRANASPRSFLTAPDIAAVTEKLKSQIADKLKCIADNSGNGQEGKDQIELSNLKLRLARAELAASELDQRIKRREERQPKSANPAASSRFTSKDFQLAADRNVLICPAQFELRFVGEYPTDNGRSSYRLYGRPDCGECSIKDRCTNGRGRRIKIVQNVEIECKTSEPPPTAPHPTEAATGSNPCGGEDEHPGGPRASITEPEAVMMLATSEKRWEPSYNADLAVTRHGVIVSQFLTKDTTDYHHFEPALQAVISAVGKPESWVGDGHYGTQSNILLADREGVFLYAPPASNAGSQEAKPPPNQAGQDSEDGNATRPPAKRFGRDDFRVDLDRNVLVCPAGQELREIGIYATDNRRGTYQLYGRSNCQDCSLKSQCTDGGGRRIRMPVVAENGTTTANTSMHPDANEGQNLGDLLQALEDRMNQVGDAVLKFRRQTIEPVNAQLKQHGLGRFHVRGLARCAAILTLACIAHNLRKWKAREIARSIRLTA